MTLVIRGGRVFDPARKIDRTADVLVERGKIGKIGKVGKAKGETVDARGLLVVPGLIDMHVHLREPGLEQKETIATGTRAAAAGGFTSVAAMANTGIPIDNEVAVVFVRTRAAEAGCVNVFPIGAISIGLKGEQLSELGKMAEAGAVAFSDDGSTVMNSEFMRRALEYVRMLDRAIICHCEDFDLTRGALMNEGKVSAELGLRGWPNAAEAAMVARDMFLAELTGGRVHIAHVSTAESVDLIRIAKKRRLPVTAEAAPHHMTLTDDRLRGYESRFRVNPPLRTQRDVDAVVRAVADGTIDAIASDHAPHTPDEKERELAATPCGLVGLETSVGVVLGELVAKRKIPLARAIDAMTAAPARILGIRKGSLKVGADADITILDPKKKWKVDPEKFRSKGRSTPWEGATLKGRAVHTIVAGRVVD
ncbi:MAG: dihydroorotase [Planctomycetota bacterium]|jgi:dihydroorotase